MTILAKLRRNIGLRLIVVSLSLAGLLLSIAIAGLFEYNDTVEIPFIKLRFQARGEMDPHPAIRIIAIDDNSIKELNSVGVSYPFPRALHAKLLRKLADSRVRVVCFDLLFDLNSKYGNEDDAALRDAILYAQSKGTEVVLAAALPEYRGGGFSQVTLQKPDDILMEANPKLGLSNTTAGEHGKGLYRDKEQAVTIYFDDTYYSQATQMYITFLADQDIEFEPSRCGIDARGYMYVNYLNGNRKRISSVQYIQLFPEVIEGVNPLNPAQENLDTASAAGGDGGWEEGETAKQLREAGKLGGTATQDDLAGTFVFVGSYSEADNDYFSTPFNVKMPGVETNASAFQTYLTGLHITPAPAWLMLLILVIACIFAGQLGYYMPSRWWSPLIAAASFIAALSLLFIAFLWWRVLLNFTYTTLSLVLSYGLTIGYKVMTEEREKAKIRKTFSRYMSEAVVNEIINNPKLAFLGGEERTVAVLFSDIRGFSTISEDMNPQDVITFLNDYFDSASRIIDSHYGYVDKFMGDGIMAVFGAPVPTDNPALDAVKCSLDMLRNLREEVHPRFRELGIPEFEIGIGVHFGTVIMGNIGSTRRTDYSIIGDTVNLAARLEALTKEYGKALIVSKEVMEIVGDQLPCNFLDTLRVKGRAQDEDIYAVEHPEIVGLTELRGYGKSKQELDD